MNISNIKTYIDVIFPAGCSLCKTHQAAYPLPVCERCNGLLLSRVALPATSTVHLPRIWSCLPYDGAIKGCIKQFKYCGKRRMVFLFTDLIRYFFTKNKIRPGTIDLVVPVPLHWTRRLSRGYNQSALIAKNVSELLNMPPAMHNLIKTKNTHSQIKLNQAERIKNLRDSFSVLHPSLLAKKSILLVDDVMTTGATLETCAMELLRSGAKTVKGFTLARKL